MGMLRGILGALLLATSAIAQDDTKTWGCLWVEKNIPGEQLLTWCVLDEERDESPCYYIEADKGVPNNELEPWVVVFAVDITERFAPSDGLCPRLPKDIPSVDNIRSPHP